MRSHCQRETTTHVTDRGGHYLLTVKGNQPALRARLKNLPWKQVPAVSAVTTSHGRRVRRTVKTLEAPEWVDFSGAAQVTQIRRTRTINGRKHIEVVYAICWLPMTDAQPAAIAAWIQGHRAIENQPHRIRDVVFDWGRPPLGEDRHQLRARNGPQVMATLRNTAISVHRLTGQPQIAAALRHHSRDSRRPIELLSTA
jgi:predicted transposase YbfD/YdcC